MSIYADQIRARAAIYVREAKTTGQAALTIQAGQIVKDLSLNNRVPAVCSALSSKKFQEENQIVLERMEGPKSGMSTTTRFIYRLEGGSGPISPLLELRGAGRQTYQELGGGEAHLRQEREAFQAR